MHGTIFYLCVRKREKKREREREREGERERERSYFLKIISERFDQATPA